ncbi:ATP-grasp domain-containing protein [Erythrobacter donghaensis]|uniref:ATP-grasp domain-containing protein n=1 Tax=Erythrobacter donghaensis TaxID=267135 RepID=UPI001302E302|nr:ATP-grasp domain-containing protein [Erythrobacter donghaensis]
MARSVLITGARAVAALDLARDFAAAGWQVHLADSRHLRMARWSRLAVSHHLYPPPRQEGEAFRHRVAALVEEQNIDFVVPTCEEVFHLAAPSLRRDLGARLFAPDLAMLRQLHDKFAFVRVCESWGLPAPESHRLESRADVARFAGEASEWVFKPCFTRFGDAALVGPAPETLERITPSPAALWLAQRRIHGREAAFYAVAHHGKLVAFAAYASDWRLGGAASYAFEPLGDGDQAMLHDLAARLAASASLHGQFACDVMIDAQGRPFLIECNPRATSGVHLLTGAGTLARAIGEGVPMTAPSRAPAYLGPAMLVYGLPQALREGRLRPWWQLFATGREAISRPGDRWPLAGALADAAGFFLEGRRHSITTTAATTRDIAWNGEELDR